MKVKSRNIFLSETLSYKTKGQTGEFFRLFMFFFMHCSNNMLNYSNIGCKNFQLIANSPSPELGYKSLKKGLSNNPSCILDDQNIEITPEFVVIGSNFNLGLVIGPYKVSNFSL